MVASYTDSMSSCNHEYPSSTAKPCENVVPDACSTTLREEIAASPTENAIFPTSTEMSPSLTAVDVGTSIANSDTTSFSRTSIATMVSSYNDSMSNCNNEYQSSTAKSCKNVARDATLSGEIGQPPTENSIFRSSTEISVMSPSTAVDLSISNSEATSFSRTSIATTVEDSMSNCNQEYQSSMAKSCKNVVPEATLRAEIRAPPTENSIFPSSTEMSVMSPSTLRDEITASPTENDIFPSSTEMSSSLTAVDLGTCISNSETSSFSRNSIVSRFDSSTYSLVNCNQSSTETENSILQNVSYTALSQSDIVYTVSSKNSADLTFDNASFISAKTDGQRIGDAKQQKMPSSKSVSESTTGISDELEIPYPFKGSSVVPTGATYIELLPLAAPSEEPSSDTPANPDYNFFTTFEQSTGAGPNAGAIENTCYGLRNRSIRNSSEFVKNDAAHNINSEIITSSRSDISCSDIEDPDYTPVSESGESEEFDVHVVERTLNENIATVKQKSKDKRQKHRGPLTELQESEDFEAGQRTGSLKKTKKQPEKKKQQHYNEQESCLRVQATKNSKGVRVWDKKHFCVFCEKGYSKIARHLLAKHKGETQVAEILNQKPGSLLRKKLLEGLRNKGNFNRNISVVTSQVGEILVNKRPSCNDVETDGKQYLPCSHCYGFFIRGMLWRHVKVCKFRIEKQGKNMQHQSLSHCLISSQDIDFPAVRELLLSKMVSDQVTLCVRNDLLILSLGNSLLEKKGHISQYYQYIIQKMRELGRLLLKIKENVKVNNLLDCITPAQFDAVVSATKNIAGYNEETRCYSIPSLALKIGHSLKKIASIVKCKAIRCGDEIQLQNAESFLKLCEMEWTNLISSNALETLKRLKMNKMNALPVTEDIMLLQKHLSEISEKAQNILVESPTLAAWGNLCQASLAQLVMFNRKRGGEAQRITLEVYKNLTNENVHSDIEKLLSPVEQQLCKMLCRVEIVGKRGRTVPVIVTPKLKKAIDILIEKRSEVEIHPSNPYVFARANPYSLTCYRGSDCLRTFAKNAELKHPETLTSTKLRKHVATVSQVMNLQEPELDQLASFMGHNLAVHRNFYRLPESTLQVAKISKILLALDKGKLSDLKGKTIDEVDINFFGE